MVRDLVEDDPLDLAREQLGVVPVEPLERPAVDRDLVGQRAGVVGAAAGERDALVEAEERVASGGLIFDDELDVGHLLAQVVRQRVDRALGQLLELVDEVGFHQRPSRVRRRMPSRACTALSSSPSLRAAQMKTYPTIASGKRTTMVAMIA